MIPLLLALQTPAPDAPSGAEIFSRMLARYDAAQSASGTIVTVQTAAGARVTTKTNVAFQRPNRLLIEQSRDGSKAGRWKAVSDGRRFSYDRPEGVFGGDRFLDPVGEQEVRDLYVAVKFSLGERSAPLDILIGQKDDLKSLVASLGPVTVVEKKTVEGTKATVIATQFKTAPGGPFVGSIRITVADDGRILEWARREVVGVPGATQEPIVVDTVTTVAVNLDTPVPDKVFSLN